MDGCDASSKDGCAMSTCLNNKDEFISREFNDLMNCWNDACCYSGNGGNPEGGHHSGSYSFDYTAMMHYHSYVAITSFDGG